MYNPLRKMMVNMISMGETSIETGKPGSNNNREGDDKNSNLARFLVVVSLLLDS